MNHTASFLLAIPLLQIYVKTPPTKIDIKF